MSISHGDDTSDGMLRVCHHAGACWQNVNFAGERYIRSHARTVPLMTLCGAHDFLCGILRPRDAESGAMWVCRADTAIPAPWSISLFNPVYMVVQSTTGIRRTSPQNVVSGYVEGVSPDTPPLPGPPPAAAKVPKQGSAQLPLADQTLV